jgi:hypothetical protein
LQGVGESRVAIEGKDSEIYIVTQECACEDHHALPYPLVLVRVRVLLVGSWISTSSEIFELTSPITTLAGAFTLLMEWR